MSSNIFFLLFLLLLLLFFPDKPLAVKKTKKKNEDNSGENAQRGKDDDAPLSNFDGIKSEVTKAWCPDVACPYMTSEMKDLCQYKWLFVHELNEGAQPSKSDSSGLMAAIKAVGREDEWQFRSDDKGLIMFLFDFATKKGVFEAKATGANSGAWKHNQIKIVDLRSDVQQLLIEGLNLSSSSTSNSSSSSSSSSSRETDTFFAVESRGSASEDHVFFLKKIFPCSRSVYYSKQPGVIQSERFRRLQNLFPMTTKIMTYSRSHLSETNVLTHWLGMKQCSFLRFPGDSGGQIDGDQKGLRLLNATCTRIVQ